MRTRIAWGLAGAAIAAGAALAVASVESAHGPDPGATGAFAIAGKPAEFDCTLCHDTNPLNSPGGKVQVLGMPATYVPGQVYPLTVKLTSTLTAGSPGRKWGFELTAVEASDGNLAGAWLLPDSVSMQVVPGVSALAGRAYVQQTWLGTQTGAAGPVQWRFNWQAPAAAAGKVYFFCAGNAANGSNGADGDWVFTTRESSLAPSLTAADPPAEGRATFAAPWPSPATKGVTLAWSLPARAPIELAIVDARGRIVRRLLAPTAAVGSGRVTWDARRDDGARAGRGVYFARLAVPSRGETLVRKIVLAP